MSWRDAPKRNIPRRTTPAASQAPLKEPDGPQWWDPRIPPGSELERALARQQGGPRRIWDTEREPLLEPKTFPE